MSFNYEAYILIYHSKAKKGLFHFRYFERYIGTQNLFLVQHMVQDYDQEQKTKKSEEKY